MNVYTNQVNIFFYDMFFILFSRNNGYAISTPADEQYRGDGLGKKKKKKFFILIALCKYSIWCTMGTGT